MSNEIQETLAERQTTHGDFNTVSDITQSMEGLLRCGPSHMYWIPEQKEAARMILQKLARAASGDHFNRDTWLDIVGYATLALKSLNKEIRVQQKRAADVSDQTV